MLDPTPQNLYVNGVPVPSASEPDVELGKASSDLHECPDGAREAEADLQPVPPALQTRQGISVSGMSEPLASRQGFSYTAIPNAFFPLIATLGYAEGLVFLHVVRLTYGFNIEEAVISYASFMKGTGLTRPSVASSIESLTKERKYVTRKQAGQSFNYSISSSLISKLVKQLNQLSSLTRSSLAAKPEVVKQLNPLKKALKKERNNIPAEKAARFKKPTVEQIREYFQDRNAYDEAQAFFDYHESKGWKVGTEPMKNWKAAVRTWIGNDFGGKQKRHTRSYEFKDENW